MSKKRVLIIAGGGTGGHVLAGVSIADEWRARWGEQARVVFVGAVGGLEEKLVPRAGYPLQLLKLGSLNRVDFKTRVRTLLLLPIAFVRSIEILISERPEAVIGVGGYASGPFVLLAAALAPFLRCRTAILEQNSVMGMTNRILAWFSDRIFSNFPGVMPPHLRAKTVVTGNPIRSSIKRLPPALLEPFTVFIFGGSQGAVGLNTLVIEALPLLGDLAQKIQWVHQTGEKDYERVSAAYRERGIGARVERFIDDMPSVYAQASLLICRAGASTMAEVAAAGRMAVFVPLPTAADGHQEKNAHIYADVGAAALVTQKPEGARELARLIETLRTHPDKIHEREKNVAAFYRPDAAKSIVSELSSD